MSPGISDSRWPPRRPGVPATDPDAALAQYPSYVAPHRAEEPRRVDRRLLAVATAYGLGVLGQVLVGFLVVLYTEVSLAGLGPVLFLVGLFFCWSQLLRVSVDRPFLIAVSGQATALACDVALRHVFLPVGLVLSGAAAVALMYLVARFRGPTP